VTPSGERPVSYRRTRDLRWSVDEAAAMHRRQEEFAAEVGGLLYLKIFAPLQDLARRWRDEAATGPAGAEARRCADELDRELTALQRGTP
jgi:hypothetical protein